MKIDGERQTAQEIDAMIAPRLPHRINLLINPLPGDVPGLRGRKKAEVQTC